MSSMYCSVQLYCRRTFHCFVFVLFYARCISPVVIFATHLVLLCLLSPFPSNFLLCIFSHCVHHAPSHQFVEQIKITWGDFSMRWHLDQNRYNFICPLLPNVIRTKTELRHRYCDMFETTLWMDNNAYCSFVQFGRTIHSVLFVASGVDFISIIINCFVTQLNLIIKLNFYKCTISWVAIVACAMSNLGYQLKQFRNSRAAGSHAAHLTYVFCMLDSLTMAMCTCQYRLNPFHLSRSVRRPNHLICSTLHAMWSMPFLHENNGTKKKRKLIKTIQIPYHRKTCQM